MSYMPEHAERLFAALTGVASPSVTWQTFCDFAKDRPDLERKWFGQIAPAYLEDLQKMGAGIFFCVNGSSTGGRKASEIDQFRAVFIDSDGAPFPSSWVVPPHAITMRSETRWHAYWFIDGDCQPDEWRLAQKTLALYYGSDETMVNPDRVLRVPGYFHMKDVMDPQQYRLEYLNDQLPRYKLRDMIGNFALDGTQQEKLLTWINQRAGRLLAGADDYNDSQANINQFIEYLTQRALQSIQGEGGDHVCFKVACAGKDYGLSPEKTYECMWHYWDARNSPPWGEEMWAKIVHAYTYSQNKLGARSYSLQLESAIVPLRGMSNEPTGDVIYVPEVVTEKAKAEKIDYAAQLAELKAMPAEQLAVAGVGAFYGKNHSTNAVAFLTSNSPNGEIIYNEEDIYAFEGKVFKQKDRKYLHSLLAREMQFVAPSDSDVNGSVSMIKNLLTWETPQKWPEWKSAPERDTSGLIVFNNGILDIVTNEWWAHTPLLRARNLLPYDYDYSAQCPNWLKFLDDVWGNSKYAPLIEQLQLWMGYLLTDDQSQQKMAIFIGKPRSGKGTMMRVIDDMVGSHNTISPSLENLLKDSMLAEMSTKMVAIFNDVADPSPSSRNSIVGNLKRIVGEDSVGFDRKYKSAMSTRFRCRVNITCNSVPNLAESSTALINRGLFFYLPTSHAGAEDFALGSRLKQEMPGIINWALQGVLKLRQIGSLRNDPCMDDRIRMVTIQTSPLEVFMSECMKPQVGASVTLMEVFQRYRQWEQKTGGGTGIRLNTFSRMIDAMRGVELEFRGSEPIITDFVMVSDIPEEYEGYAAP